MVAWGKRGVVAKCVTEKMTFKVKVSQLGSKHTQGVRRSCNQSQILETNGGSGGCVIYVMHCQIITQH